MCVCETIQNRTDANIWNLDNLVYNIDLQPQSSPLILQREQTNKIKISGRIWQTNETSHINTSKEPIPKKKKSPRNIPNVPLLIRAIFIKVILSVFFCWSYARNTGWALGINMMMMMIYQSNCMGSSFWTKFVIFLQS